MVLLGAQWVMATTPANKQGRILLQYLNRWNFLSAHIHLSASSIISTDESEAHKSISAIGHILCPSQMLPRFLSCHVIEEEPSNTSYHLPITCLLNADLPQSTAHHQKKPNLPPRPNRKQLTSYQLYLIQHHWRVICPNYHFHPRKTTPTPTLLTKCSQNSPP